MILVMDDIDKVTEESSAKGPGGNFLCAQSDNTCRTSHDYHNGDDDDESDDQDDEDLIIIGMMTRIPIVSKEALNTFVDGDQIERELM